VIIMAGIPFRTAGSTNIIHVVRLIGDELERYQPGSNPGRRSTDKAPS
jgi:pyruvate kinase